MIFRVTWGVVRVNEGILRVNGGLRINGRIIVGKSGGNTRKYGSKQEKFEAEIREEINEISKDPKLYRHKERPIETESFQTGEFLKYIIKIIQDPEK